MMITWTREIFKGRGVLYKKKEKNWVFGIFEENVVQKIIKKGSGNFPEEIIVHLRYEYHLKNPSFLDYFQSKEVYELLETSKSS